MPATLLSLADAASRLSVRPVRLAQAVREDKVATVRGHGGELLITHERANGAIWTRWLRREGIGVWMIARPHWQVG